MHERKRRYYDSDESVAETMTPAEKKPIHLDEKTEKKTERAKKEFKERLTKQKSKQEEKHGTRKT